MGKPRPGKKSAPALKGTFTTDIEEIATRAARLGITPERVLWEYAAMAFADLRHIVEWGPDGLRIKALNTMSDADLAAIEEIVPGSDPEHPRIRLYNRKAALDAIARHLGMFPAPPRRRDDGPPEPAEDPREVLERRLARLAARTGEK